MYVRARGGLFCFVLCRACRSKRRAWCVACVVECFELPLALACPPLVAVGALRDDANQEINESMNIFTAVSPTKRPTHQSSEFLLNHSFNQNFNQSTVSRTLSATLTEEIRRDCYSSATFNTNTTNKYFTAAVALEDVRFKSEWNMYV